MKLIKHKPLNAGDQTEIAEERLEKDLSFNFYKYNNRPTPIDGRDRLIISSLSEFGCETISLMYCIPEIIQRYPGKYKIIVGWHGREYLYRHLCDEFWELKEDHQWLRNYCRAFHHTSQNLFRLENKLQDNGRVVPAAMLGRIAIGAKCQGCKRVWSTTNLERRCHACGHDDIRQSFFGDVNGYKPNAVHIPIPNKDVSKFLEPNKKYVGVFARGRKCYGRNLSPDFYVKMINLIRSRGYDIIWFGEKGNTISCPDPTITDFSKMEEGNDLELVLSLIKQLKFTVQFWTASTRLSAMVGTPYLLFESPDQMWGHGQEGIRRKLFDFSPSKLCAAQYLDFSEDSDYALESVKLAIEDIEHDNWEDIFRVKDNLKVIKAMRDKFNEKFA